MHSRQPRAARSDRIRKRIGAMARTSLSLARIARHVGRAISVGALRALLIEQLLLTYG